MGSMIIVLRWQGTLRLIARRNPASVYCLRKCVPSCRAPLQFIRVLCNEIRERGTKKSTGRTCAHDEKYPGKYSDSGYSHC